MNKLRARCIELDTHIIRFLRNIGPGLSRVALFVVFFWFGILKVISLSPASPLVQALFEKIISGISFADFMILFGTYEMLIGISFLIPHFERAAIFLLFFHMGMTMLPLILLPELTWTAVFVPTLEGQYIIKNLVIMALAFGIGAHLHIRHIASHGSHS